MLCYFCMREKNDTGACPYCGAAGVPHRQPHQLAPGSVVGRRYSVGRVLGEGGFGITYIGLDQVLKIPVAVKEYFPHGYAHRERNTLEVTLSSDEESAAIYEKGKDRFLQEACDIARFRKDPVIVDVRDYFEENNTAYIVMEYLDGVTLRAGLKRNGLLTPDSAYRLLRPVMRSLSRIHETGLIHRDISPDNMMVQNDGSIKLMDFGSAREFAADQRSMSVLLKPGYAPVEQYRRYSEQGPWTDVYGMCATMYLCITGKTPPDSIDRLFEDTLQPPSALGVAIDPKMEEALLYGLAVQKENRCPDMARLIELMDRAQSTPTPSESPSRPEPVVPADPDLTIVAQDASPTSPDSDLTIVAQDTPPTPAPKKKRKAIFLIAGAALLLVLLAAGGIIWYLLQPSSTKEYSNKAIDDKVASTEFSNDNLLMEYDENGNLLRVTGYYDSGAISYISEYDENEDWVQMYSFYETGEILEIQTPERITCYYESGAIWSIMELGENATPIINTEYYENGEIKFIQEFNEDGINTKSTWYDKNGNLEHVDEYDEKNGDWLRAIYYYSDGRIASIEE